MARAQLWPAKVKPKIRVGDASDVGEKVLVDVAISIVVFLIVT